MLSGVQKTRWPSIDVNTSCEMNKLFHSSILIYKLIRIVKGKTAFN